MKELLLQFILGSLGLFIFAGALIMFYILYKYYKEVSDNRATRCKWVNNEGDCYEYNTSCNNTFQNASESPVTDWLDYCPYCSGKVGVK